MIRRRFWTAILALLWLFLIPQDRGAAQNTRSISLTPTFQASVSQFDPVLSGSDYLAYGVMVGMPKTGGWWTPHVWYQRYSITSITRGSLPSAAGSETTGWQLSVGPAMEFLSSGSWDGVFMPQIGIGSSGSQSVKGGAGVHFGFDGGFLQPQLFGRFQTLGPGWFWTIGFGLTVEFTWEGSSDRSPWG